LIYSAREIPELRMTTISNERPQYNILLAEDSAADVSIVRIALRRHNLDHVLHIARDGEEAIAFIEKADRDSTAPGPDLLLLDMHLPRFNGEQILKRLRSTERYAQTPVVVMTSSAALEDRQRAQKHAALFYFQKPSSMDEFVQLGAIVRDILIGKTQLRNTRSPEGGQPA
jgi:CheY-like chemotaxis protein